MHDTVSGDSQNHYVNSSMHPLPVLKTVVDKRTDIKNTQNAKNSNAGGGWFEVLIFTV